LARPAAEVTLLDVVAAVEGTEPAFRCTEIRQRGPAGLAPSNYKIPCGIARAMLRAEHAWRESLRGTTIADLLVGLAQDVEPKAAVKATAWMQEALR
jgi:DNA-binding IscR family transcriptional regulator